MPKSIETSAFKVRRLLSGTRSRNINTTIEMPLVGEPSSPTVPPEIAERLFAIMGAVRPQIAELVDNTVGYVFEKRGVDWLLKGEFARFEGELDEILAPLKALPNDRLKVTPRVELALHCLKHYFYRLVNAAEEEWKRELDRDQSDEEYHDE